MSRSSIISISLSVISLTLLLVGAHHANFPTIAAGAFCAVTAAIVGAYGEQK